MMYKFVKKFTAAVLAGVMAVNMATAANADASPSKSPYLDFTEYAAELTADAPPDESAHYYYVAKKLTVKKDFTLPKGKELYIREGGELVIKNGASFTAEGSLTVERGGIVSVEKGNFTSTRLIYNFGTIKVGKNGSLTVSGGGSYRSNAGSRLIQEGEIVFGSLRLSDLTDRILKYDKNFSLDSYCLRAYNCDDGFPSYFSNHKIVLNYCIGDIETDYYYQATNDTAHPKLTRKIYSLSRVYNAQRAEKLRRAAEKYAEENDLYKDYTDPSCFKVDIGFTYSYKTRILDAHAYGFHAAWWNDGEDDEEEGFYYMDMVTEEKVGRF